MPTDPTGLCDLSAAELTAAYRRRALSAVEVAEAVLARIEAQNPQVNAFSFLDPEATLAMAKRSEARWMRGDPLGPGDGIPVTIKDNMLTAGWPARAGSRTVEPDQPGREDSPIVARLREAGCVFVGKTTTPEFAWKAVTDSSLNGVSRNPHDLRLTPGGSSGGAAIAAALGMGVWHAASDAAGSIRIPAAFCGVVGFKPTHGVVPIYPPSAFSGLGHHGPISRSVADAVAMLDIVARPDPRDPTAIRLAQGVSEGLQAGISGLRIGYADPCGFTDPKISSNFAEALRTLCSLGAEVSEVHLDLAGTREQVEIFWRVGCALIVGSVPEEKRELVDPELRRKAAQAEGVSGVAHRRAQIEREFFAARLQCLFQDHDLIVTPTVPVLPFEAGRNVPEGYPTDEWMDWAPYSYPFNLTQQPAISVPLGGGAGEVLAGLQIIAPRFADALVLRSAHAFESVRADREPLRPLPCS